VDGAGNIYVLDQDPYPTFTVHSINVYAAASPTGKPIRSLPVGPGAKIANAWTLTVSKAGDIYVYDGTGIAVFDATATGDADPVRYIQGAAANYMTVDDGGNLYVGSNRSDWPIMVYGPKDTGAVVPARAIGGSQTSMGSACAGYAIVGMAVNNAGEIYVLYVCPLTRTSTAPITLYKFSATANGNVAPDKSLTLDGPHFGTGLALDSAGNIYISTGDGVYEYVAGAFGNSIASNTLTSSRLSRMPPPPGEDDWTDPGGTIVLH
jgi:hypothetical protein